MILVKLSDKIHLAGMFAVINYFVEFLCDRENKNDSQKYVINLDNYTMYQDQAGDDVFKYYFTPKNHFDNLNDITETIIVPVKVKPYISRRGLMTKLGRTNARELLAPRNEDREFIGRVINKYFALNAQCQRIVDDFYNKKFSNAPVVGVHLRGAGRLDGGAARFKLYYELEEGIPFAAYFDKINEFIKKQSDAKILICSDSQKVIRRMKKEYGDRVINYDAQLTEYGEGHISCLQSKERGDENAYNARQMGQDVIVETWLLSKCDYFVHGNSNISNFINCLNPRLEHHDVFSGLYSEDCRGITYAKMRFQSIFYYWTSLFRRCLGLINKKWGCPED